MRISQEFLQFVDSTEGEETKQSSQNEESKHMCSDVNICNAHDVS